MSTVWSFFWVDTQPRQAVSLVRVFTQCCPAHHPPSVLALRPINLPARPQLCHATCTHAHSRRMPAVAASHAGGVPCGPSSRHAAGLMALAADGST